MLILEIYTVVGGGRGKEREEKRRKNNEIPRSTSNYANNSLNVWGEIKK